MIRNRPATTGLVLALLCLVILAVIYDSPAVWEAVRVLFIIMGILGIVWLNVQLVEVEREGS